MILLIIAAAAVAAAPAPVKAADVAGSWTLDLRVNRAVDTPYTKPMILNVGADGHVTGEFYNSTIEDGHASASNGRACFAIRTSDGRAPYQHSGCRVGDHIEGLSWSEGRKFLLSWVAARTAP